MSLAATLKAATGTLSAVQAGTLLAELPVATLGSWCMVKRLDATELLARVTGFEGKRFVLTPYDDIDGVYPGAPVKTLLSLDGLFPAPSAPNAVLNFRGEFQSTIELESHHLLSHGDQAQPPDSVRGLHFHISQDSIDPFADAPDYSARTAIDTQLHTGFQSIDSFIPFGRGQRLALLAKPGVGKTTLLTQIAARVECDIIVLALVGERGREIAECREMLVAAGLASKTIVVSSSSDESAGKRALAPFTATAIAEAYQRQGYHVLLLVDSLTRTARAIRDYSLGAGELPVRQGYTPSVYRELPRLLERAGSMQRGSISAIYSLLQDGPDELDSLSSELRSLLDGHIVLSEELVRWGIRPAVDIFQSLSRLSAVLKPTEELVQLSDLKAHFARIYERKKMADLGVTDPLNAEEERHFEELRAFLRQQ